MTSLPATTTAPTGTMLRTLAFITGCGRSGTTILGQILSHHPHVMYLNDRFDLWVDPLPMTDIWGRRELAGRGSESAEARVALTAADARSIADDDRRSFLAGLHRERRGKPVLIEKLAINNFRLPFLRELFPDAALINIVRHGVEVARSIERKAQVGQWYGLNDRKWSLLSEHARTAGYGDLLPLCTGPYEKGLLEWRMSVEAAETFFGEYAAAQALQLRYDELIRNPLGICERLEAFLGLPPDAGMRRFCTDQVRRLNPAAEEAPIPPATAAIAGETLARLGYSI